MCAYINTYNQATDYIYAGINKTESTCHTSLDISISYHWCGNAKYEHKSFQSIIKSYVHVVAEYTTYYENFE